MVFGNLLALQAELEAMKLDNDIRRMQGLDTFNYGPDAFFEKAQEIRSAMANFIRSAITNLPF